MKFHSNTDNLPITYYKEKFRPQYHFSPKRNFINDPCGLVYFQGEYHLFYQYNPFDIDQDPNILYWGHAISTDLLHWKHMPIALAPDDNGGISTGCAVVDWKNTSGLFAGKPGLIIIFVYVRYDVFEAPAIAYSDDRGRTWEKLNTHVPLIDPAPSGQLKDVKIFWHKPDKKWIMVSTSDVLRIFSSPNLLEWTPESDIVGVRSSCPDLFELPIDNDNSNTKWVLSLAGRSYHLGSFDGHEFKVETPAIPMNHGPDAFASQTWSDTPDGRRIILDWMMNWSYARRLDIIPTRPWNGAMSLPRSLSLKTTSHGLRLFQNPIEDISQLHTESSVYENLQISANRVFKPDLTGTCVDIEAEIELRGKTIFGIHIAESNRTKYVFNHSSHDIDGERTTINYDLSKKKLNLDRRTSGTIYDKDFASEYFCTLVPQKDRITLRILLDWSSVEVFANNGELVLSALIFPTPFGGGITIFVERGEILIHQLKIHKIRSVWD